MKHGHRLFIGVALAWAAAAVVAQERVIHWALQGVAVQPYPDNYDVDCSLVACDPIVGRFDVIVGSNGLRLGAYQIAYPSHELFIDSRSRKADARMIGPTRLFFGVSESGVDEYGVRHGGSVRLSVDGDLGVSRARLPVAGASVYYMWHPQYDNGWAAAGRGGYVVQVPEPATWAMLAGGLVVLGGVQVRRRRSRAASQPH